MQNYVIGLLLISSCSIHSMFLDRTHSRFDYAICKDDQGTMRQRMVDLGTKCKIRCYVNENKESEWRLTINGKQIYAILNSKNLSPFLKSDMDAYVWIDSECTRFTTRIIANNVSFSAILQRLNESKNRG